MLKKVLFIGLFLVVSNVQISEASERSIPRSSDPLLERLLRRNFAISGNIAAPVITVNQEDQLPAYDPIKLPTYESLLPPPPPYQRFSN